ncbi:hypothetical protein O1611_g522 [Lasiodiplodia mahajangana]|uniref:Uncharacterized protein n=1 Tax=Lasiodiplodia mahajangana TaxID=1108764 RepID=A0ACC2JZX7_9PEZI|nr:hypothetical protein O1611_g522 [Lasiodiplodia mahajangana]
MSLASERKRRLGDDDQTIPERIRIEPKPKRLAKGDYTFGWISALGVEKAAALAILDEEYEGLPQEKGDTNNYSFGRIGSHNIVIAGLPAGKYGTVNAAIVAANMHRTFPSLVGYLMVGIAGGAGTADVRLGDVVVSSEVLQYDLGTHTSEGFITKSIPLQSSPLFRAAVSALQTKYIMDASKIPTTIEQMAKDYPKMESFTRKESLRDWLFHDTYSHSGSKSSCVGCDKTHLVEREPRQDDDPRIHYGVVASGNSLIRSTAVRNMLAEKHGALCFEMEGAGIIENHPCLVIRSICDYADSHKNKQWQPYAAAVAAAYAKELLNGIPAQNIPSSIRAIDDKTRGSVEVLMGSLSFPGSRPRETESWRGEDGTCEWILHHCRYAAWLDLESRAQNHGLLWVRGKPGAGKSTLTKFVHHKLRSTGTYEVISFFFNARGAILERSIEGMYRSILDQLLHSFPDLQMVLADPGLPNAAAANRVGWDVDTLRDIFEKAVLRLGEEKLICFIDALDECNEAVDSLVKDFKRLGNLASKNNVGLFMWFSSRPYPVPPLISDPMLDMEEEKGHKDDLKKYIDHNLDIGSGLDVAEIKATLFSKAADVFLWLFLVIRILNELYRNGRGHEIKGKLADTPTELNELFMEIITKDTKDMDEFLLSIQWILYAQVRLTVKQFYYAIQAGLSPKKQDKQDPDQISKDKMLQFISSSSKGLAEANSDGIIQFIHESVRAFLFLTKGGGIGEVWPHLKDGFQYRSHDRLKKCCYAYIRASSSNVMREFPYYFETPPLTIAAQEWEEDDESTSRVAGAPNKHLNGLVDQKFPLLRYATKYVLLHADMAACWTVRGHNTSISSCHATAGLRHAVFLKIFDVQNWARLYNELCGDDRERYYHTHQLPANLLYALTKMKCSRLIRAIVWYVPFIHISLGEWKYSLFAALRWRHGEVVDALLQIGSFQAGTMSAPQNLPPDWKYTPTGPYTPLSLAAEAGHETLVRILLNGGVSPNTLDPEGYSPVYRAVSKGHKRVVEILLNSGANTDSRYGPTPLRYAVCCSSIELVKLLLDRGARVDERDNNGRTPLSLAAEWDHEKITELLLDQIDRQDENGGTNLFWAAAYAKRKIAELLLNRGALIDRTDENGETPLFWAAACAGRKIAELLLNRGAQIDWKDENGETPLFWAIKQSPKRVDPFLDQGRQYEMTPVSQASKRRNSEVIELLLARGAKVNVSDNTGMTPLLLATKYGTRETVARLLDFGAEVDVSNEDGMTPLLFAAKHGPGEIVELLLDKGCKLDVSNKDGMTPLLFAAKHGPKKIVKALLERGARLDESNNDGMTPLHMAMYNQSPRYIMLLLLLRGSDINASNRNGETPLHLSIILGTTRLVAEELLSRGASIDASNDEGVIALRLLLEQRNPLLRERRNDLQQHQQADTRI